MRVYQPVLALKKKHSIHSQLYDQTHYLRNALTAKNVTKPQTQILLEEHTFAKKKTNITSQTGLENHTETWK